MFCYQCEQAAKGTGCKKIGVCGKEPNVADLQDVLIYQLKGIGYLAHALRENNISTPIADRFVMEGLFTTVTNVNFDPERLAGWIKKAQEVKNGLKGLYEKEFKNSTLPASATFVNGAGIQDMVNDAVVIEGIGVLAIQNEDVRSLQELLMYGLKGVAAYADHAAILGETDDAIPAFFHKALSALNNVDASVDSLVELVMECGTINIRAMEILDKGHTERFGHPEPTVVSTALKKGPAIVITGHDMLVMEKLLKQTEGKGVNVYTHGEMLPAHGYPAFKKYPHFAGHFGTAWQNQQKEFDGVPAAFLFNTNCIQKPRESYMDQVFTTDLVAWPGVKHIDDHDFTPVIEKAIALGGLKDTPGGTLMTGFGRNAVMSVADKVIEGVKAGAIKHFMLVGGCDGAKPGRNYYTELVEQAPKDTVILTLACGKFRFNHLDLGDIGGIPRLLDVGQCNDAYSAVKIAMALAEAFDCGINDLPLSLVLSWYEQKAVAVLLSLLALGVKGIRLGPTLPAFITPNILNFLVEQFDIKPISTVEEDLKAILA